MKPPIARSSFFIVLFALGIAACSSGEPKISAIPNQSASLVGQLSANPLQWRIITSVVDRSDRTMATLYGNDRAVGYVRTHLQHDYPAGSMLSLVTWDQQEDARWFGANIPNQVKSVEFVTVETGADGRPSYSYEKYEGQPLKKSADQEALAATERAMYMISQRAAVLP